MANKNLQIAALVIAAIGAINIGLAQLGLDVLNMIFGSVPVLMQIVNYVIGLSGIYALVKVLK